MNNEEASSFRAERARRAARTAVNRGGRAQYPESIHRTAGQNTMPPVRARTLATPSISSLQRHRLRRHRDEGDSLSESLSTVQEAVDRLNEASNNLSSLLEEPIPRIMPPDIITSEYYGEAEVNRRRAKRRKLDSGTAVQGFKYGYRGQVISGPLKMGILSCDGGHISEATGRSRITHYAPQNILRNDKSVYCTESSDCNIIFSHVGDTPFNLKKVVIKAPKSGFDAPIQEGMIFVSMTSEDLLTRTSHYRLREPSPPALASSRTISEDDDTLERVLLNSTDPRYRDLYSLLSRSEFQREAWTTLRPPSRRADYPSAYLITVPPSNDYSEHSRARSYDPSRSLQQSSDLPALDPRDNPVSSGQPLMVPVAIISPFHVTASSDDPSGDEEEESSPAVLADLADRCRRDYPFSSSSSEDEVDEGQSRALRRRIRRLRASPRKVEWSTGEDTGGTASGTRPEPEILAPHAKFFIESKHGMVSVKFDPPVTGRFILFKLWSPAEGQNIDIQSIMCYGFAGPRYFPAIKML